MGSCFKGLRAALYRVFGFRLGPLSIVPWRKSRIRKLGEADPKAESSESSSQSYEGDPETREQFNAVLEELNKEQPAQAPPAGAAETEEEEMNRLVKDYEDSLNRTKKEIQLQESISEKFKRLEQRRDQLLQSFQSTSSPVAQNVEVVGVLFQKPVEDHQGGMAEIDDDNSTDEENEEFHRQRQVQAEKHARELEIVRRRRRRN